MTDPPSPKPRTIAQLPWIKVRVGLPRDPAVFFVAQRLKLRPPHVVGLLVELWGWADGVTSDGRIMGVSPADIDRIVRCKGFAAALAAVPEHPWIEVHDGYLILPRFDRHNGTTAKRRANDAERTRADRMDPSSPRFVRDSSASDADRLRARGEERILEEPLPLAGQGVAGATPHPGKRPNREDAVASVRAVYAVAPDKRPAVIAALHPDVQAAAEKAGGFHALGQMNDFEFNRAFRAAYRRWQRGAPNGHAA